MWSAAAQAAVVRVELRVGAEADRRAEIAPDRRGAWRGPTFRFRIRGHCRAEGEGA